jgi:phenylalanine ammonia-lyase
LKLAQIDMLSSKICAAVDSKLESTSTMDAEPRFAAAAAASTVPIVDFFTSQPNSPLSILTNIAEFRSRLASRSVQLQERLRTEYLSGTRGPAPASRFLNKTRPVYEFIRVTLGIKMHGEVNRKMFMDELGTEQSIGQNVSLIHEVRYIAHRSDGLLLIGYLSLQAIRDGKMQATVVGLFDQSLST